jgi:hypothetical protein
VRGEWSDSFRETSPIQCYGGSAAVRTPSLTAVRAALGLSMPNAARLPFQIKISALRQARPFSSSCDGASCGVHHGMVVHHHVVMVHHVMMHHGLGSHRSAGRRRGIRTSKAGPRQRPRIVEVPLSPPFIGQGRVCCRCRVPTRGASGRRGEGHGSGKPGRISTSTMWPARIRSHRIWDSYDGPARNVAIPAAGIGRLKR